MTCRSELFAGESMFHHARAASEVDLVRLVDILSQTDAIIDVQWPTDNLVSLGAIEIPRPDYLPRLDPACPASSPFD